MNIKPKQIQTYDDLKRQAATVGMVLSGIRAGHEVPDRDRYLTVGLELCDIVAERVRLEQSTAAKTYDELAFIDLFYREPEKTVLKYPDQLRDRALAVRNVLERLLHLEEMPAADVADSATFCHLVYHAF
jgi:hypothetical protein